MTKVLTKYSEQSLARASERSMHEWYLRKMLASGGKIIKDQGLIYGYHPLPANLMGAHRIISFPKLRKNNADHQIKKMLLFFRKYDVAPWCTCGRVTTTDLVRRYLRAWGFVYQYPGICMASKIANLRQSFAWPKGLTVEIQQMDENFDKFDHPTFGDMDKLTAQNSLKASLILAQKRPQEVWNFLAKFGDKPVAYTMLSLSNGVAGVYDVGVVPSARSKNIGKAIIYKTCQQAKDLGFKVAVLQTGSVLMKFYSEFGFRTVSEIDHWRYPWGLMSEPLTKTKANSAKINVDWRLNDQFKTFLLTGKEDMAVNFLRKHKHLANEPFLGSKRVMPLHSAAWNGHNRVVNELIKLGADIETCDEDNGSTPLIWAVHGLGDEGPQFKKNQLKCAEILIKNGANVLFVNKWKHSAIEIASKFKNKTMLNLLNEKN